MTNTFTTTLTKEDQAKVPNGKYEFITKARALTLLDEPIGHRPRIYAYIERGDYAGQIVSLRSVQNLEEYDETIGFAWIGLNSVKDIIYQR